MTIEARESQGDMASVEVTLLLLIDYYHLDLEKILKFENGK